MMMMGAVGSSEKSVNIYQTTWCYIQEDSQQFLVGEVFMFSDKCPARNKNNLIAHYV
jgi:hypothetical protein